MLRRLEKCLSEGGSSGCGCSSSRNSCNTCSIKSPASTWMRRAVVEVTVAMAVGTRQWRGTDEVATYDIFRHFECRPADQDLGGLYLTRDTWQGGGFEL